MITTAPPLVFVVEDHLLVQMWLEEGLKHAGCDVIVADNAADATGAIARAGYRIGALVINVHLDGEASGWDVARRCRLLGFAFPVIYTSARRVPDGSPDTVPNSLVVHRPFRMEQIVAGLSVLSEAADAPALGSLSRRTPSRRDFRRPIPAGVV